MDIGGILAVLGVIFFGLLALAICFFSVRLHRPPPVPEPAPHAFVVVATDQDCCVCMDAKAGVLFPCGHAAVCAECAQRIAACPLCRQRLTAAHLVLLHSAV